MKTFLKYLSIIILLAFAAGFVVKYTQDPGVGDLIIGLGVLASSFILLPLWLYHSWKGKRYEDYTLTNENIRKMKEREEQKNSRDKF